MSFLKNNSTIVCDASLDITFRQSHTKSFHINII
nr:MAG TPA: hypothetical protein [Caudoviricetes sp.]